MSRTNFRRHRIGVVALAALGLIGLAACGSGSSNPSNDTPGATLSISGTAATGLAIAGQQVDAKCNGGMGSATTNADGRYTVSVEGAVSLPCTLRVTTAGGQVLHSLATGTGTTARANITPLSELIVARLAGGDPASFYANFDAAAADALTAENVQSAVVAMLEMLESAGIDFTEIGNVLTAELVAATADGAQGNAFDRALDALKAAVEASGTTLAELTETVARMSPVSSATPNGVASLPPELLLRRAAADCPSLRDGRYRVVHPLLTDKSRTLELDAATLTFEWDDGTTTTWNATGEACKYERNSGYTQKNTMKISPAGVGLMALQLPSNVHVIGVLFPEQKIPVAELAGDWITLEWLQDDPSTYFELVSAEMNLDAAGKVTAWTDCGGAQLTECMAEAPGDSAFVAHEQGGFAGAGTDLSGMRAFAYRSGSGDLMMALHDENSGNVGFATKKHVRAMPKLGQAVGSWSAVINRQGGVISEIGFGLDYRKLPKRTFRVTGIVDENTYVRTDDDTAVAQTMKVNDPRSGFVRRVAGDSGVAGDSEVAMLGLRGMDLTAFGKLNDIGLTGFYGVAIDLR